MPIALRTASGEDRPCPTTTSPATPSSGAPASAMTTEEESAIEEDDLETSYYRDEVIDLDELMREQFYLALPMKPLCREDCRGLCPQCGVNLNSGTCDCVAEWKDPRLAPLEAMKRTQNNA